MADHTPLPPKPATIPPPANAPDVISEQRFSPAPFAAPSAPVPPSPETETDTVSFQPAQNQEAASEPLRESSPQTAALERHLAEAIHAQAVKPPVTEKAEERKLGLV